MPNRQHQSWRLRRLREHVNKSELKKNEEKESELHSYHFLER